MPGTSGAPAAGESSSQRTEAAKRRAGSTVTITTEAEPVDTPAFGVRPAGRLSGWFGPSLMWCRRHAVFLAVALATSVLWITNPPASVLSVQDAEVLATVIVVYVLLLRWAVWRWLAALATGPVLWNTYVLAGKQTVFNYTFLVLMVAVGLLVVGWRARSRTRFADAVVVVLGVAIPVLAYVIWYRYVAGGYGLGQREAAGDHLGVAAVLDYRSHGYLAGPLLVGSLLLALLAGAGLGRARPSGMRAVCLLSAIVPACTLLGVIGLAESLPPIQLPGLVLWPVAGALGLTALLRGRRAPAAGRSQIDDVDRAALAAFRDRYADPTLAPVVVVIAAYNEATGLPRVLSSMPSTVCGLAADVVIVDDGSTDDTSAAANAHDGAYLVSCSVNRGQGAAMRLGYRVAREHGARYIITTDADAQYDAADFPTVLAPLLDGSADFVTGSRRLGRQHTIDRFRRAGVYVFAWIVSALTGERFTDTSFGLRAMRADVTAMITLNQPQYQSAELLIGVHSHGCRILEVPATMHRRAAGSTKKGGNLVYGMRYARVVFGTWWREGCPAPAREHAPAMLVRRDLTGTAHISGC